MHKDRNQNKSVLLKNKAKHHWSNLNDKPLNRLNIERNRADEDVYDAQKIKSHRADKRLKNVNQWSNAMSLESYRDN